MSACFCSPQEAGAAGLGTRPVFIWSHCVYTTHIHMHVCSYAHLRRHFWYSASLHVGKRWRTLWRKHCNTAILASAEINNSPKCELSLSASVAKQGWTWIKLSLVTLPTSEGEGTLPLYTVPHNCTGTKLVIQCTLLLILSTVYHCNRE